MVREIREEHFANIIVILVRSLRSLRCVAAAGAKGGGDDSQDACVRGLAKGKVPKPKDVWHLGFVRRAAFFVSFCRGHCLK